MSFPFTPPQIRPPGDFKRPDGTFDVMGWAQMLSSAVNNAFGQLEAMSRIQDRGNAPGKQFILSNYGGATDQRTLDLSAATLTDVRQVLGTLLHALGQKGGLRVET